MGMMPTDNHVHSRWSWDTATSSSMQLACARATEIGLPGLAFTEHVDFTEWSQQDSAELAGTSAPTVTQPARIDARPRVAPLDVEGYSADLARCRDEFPDLRILSGIEAGEPHLFPASVAAVLLPGTSSGCSAACTGSCTTARSQVSTTHCSPASMRTR